MVIYKKVDTIAPDGTSVVHDVQVEYSEIGTIFRDIVGDGKFLCSICLEPLYDIQLVDMVLRQEETKERLTGAINLDESNLGGRQS